MVVIIQILSIAFAKVHKPSFRKCRTAWHVVPVCLIERKGGAPRRSHVRQYVLLFEIRLPQIEVGLPCFAERLHDSSWLSQQKRRHYRRGGNNGLYATMVSFIWLIVSSQAQAILISHLIPVGIDINGCILETNSLYFQTSRHSDNKR